jgi:hypothetical protein
MLLEARPHAPDADVDEMTATQRTSQTGISFLLKRKLRRSGM